MAGEIATAYVAVLPSMHGFGKSMATQIGPQATAVGDKAGRQAGSAFVQSASKQSSNWFSETAKNAIKNVTLYGSMYVAISKAQQGISAMFDAMVGFNAELEQATIGFETMLGSAGAAEAHMQWIKDFARETPFQYGDLVAYSQQLLALGFSAEMSKDVLEATGDAAAALGRGSESIQRINLALGQMWTKGKVQSQEMLQLTEAGIGAWQILAEAYGVSVEEVQAAVTAGQIKATEAVPALIAGMNARFGGLMERQSQTYAGILSNVQDTLQQQLAKAGEPLFRELKTLAEEFLEALSDPEVIKIMERIGQYAETAVRAFADVVKFAWQFKDVIFEIGFALAASKLVSGLAIGGAGSLLSVATWTQSLAAMRAYRNGLESMSGLEATRGLGTLLNVGRVVGIAATLDGYRRLSDAGADATKKALGLGEALAGGALAGAAFGGVAGAAIGAVAGLTAGLFSMGAASRAANNDMSLGIQALKDLGVEANLAALALSGVTQSELAAGGGFDAILSAMKGGTYAEYVAGLGKQLEALDAAAAGVKQRISDLSTGGVEAGPDPNTYGPLLDQLTALTAKSEELNALMERLGINNSALAAANEQIVSSGYQAAFAMDMQTGSLGSLSAAAWAAIVAEGGLGAEALYAAARMEGLAGVAGYATQMIAGIPTGTSINFNTNAADILPKILQLRVAVDSARNADQSADAKKQLAKLLAEYNSALTSTSSTLKLPTSGGAASKAAQAVSQAAEEAARKLEQDRTAQVRFGDAFGSLMEAALEGNFDQYRDRLQEQITSLTRDGYTVAADTLKRMSGTLTQAALDYSALTNKLKAASSAYKDLTEDMRDQFSASRDLILGLGQATDAQSFSQLAYLLGETTSRATEYQDVLTQLKDLGLSEDLWNQLAQAGPESMGLAQSILMQGAAGIEQLNSLSGGLVDAANSMGELVSQSMYQQGVDAMQAYIEGLESQSSALEAQLETIANNILTKTAGAITPGNAGYSLVSAAPQQTVYNFGDITFDASKLQELESIQDLIDLLEQAPTTEMVNQAGTVTS